MYAVMDEQWLNWVKENLERGCESEGLFRILLENNFSPKDIRNAMGVEFPAHSPLVHTGFIAPTAQPVIETVDHQKLYDIGDRLLLDPNIKKVDTPLVQIFTYDNFMSETECDEVMRISSERLEPSVYSFQDQDPNRSFRTNRSAHWKEGASTLLHKIRDRACTIMGIDAKYTEPMQTQWYDVGNDLKQHTDFFEPNSVEYDEYGPIAGQRTWTFMFYLQPATQGGQTHFSSIQKTFPGKRGQAILWNNLYADGSPNRNTWHGSLPIEAGIKTIITLWFREQDTSKMFL